MRLEDTLRERADARFLVAEELVLDREDHRAWLASARLELGSKSLAVLEELMRQPQLLVTKDRLFEAGWPGQATSDAVLTTAIRELRRALGDSAREPAWIETQHGKGYRFLRPVEGHAVHPGRRAASRPDAPEVRRKPPIALVAAGLLAAIVLVALAWWTTSRPSSDAPGGLAEEPVAQRVAVLPLTVESGEEWLGGAISSRLSEVLQKSPGIFVADARMAQDIAGAEDRLAVARAEEIGTLVGGSVRAEDGRLHVDVEVRDDAGTLVWSRRFSDSEADLIALTERIVFETARALKVASDPAQVERMARLGTRSLDAFEAYARAQQILDSVESFRSRDSFDLAMENLEHAVALDPTFAKASLDLAWFTFPGAFASDPEPAEAKALALLEMAVRHAANDWDREAAQAQLDLRMLRFAKARARLMSLYRETSATSAPLNHSILLMLRKIALATRDRELTEFAWRELTEYNLARGRIQMSDPTAIAHSPEMLERFAAYQAQQEPTPVGIYRRHTALLLAGRTQDAAVMLAADQSLADNPFASLMKAGQACAEGRVEDARRTARNASDGAGTSDYAKWKLAQIAGLADQAERMAPKQTSDAGQRALVDMLAEPGFDPENYPLLAAAMARADARPTPLARPKGYCPLSPD